MLVLITKSLNEETQSQNNIHIDAALEYKLP